MENRRLAAIFKEIADILEIQDANPFRIRSYRRAAQTIESAPFEVGQASLFDEERVQELPGIGKAILSKIQELTESGKCEEHESLKQEVPPSMLQMLQLQNLGPKKIALFQKTLGISSVEELEEAARNQKLRSVAGMGEKSEAKLLKSIQEFRQHEGRYRIDLVKELSRNIVEHLRGQAPVLEVSPAGSLRREKETIGDLDILVSTKDAEATIQSFLKIEGFREVLAQGDTKVSVVTDEGVQIDLRVVEEDSFGAALQYFTGSKDHNVQLRERAKRLGLKINEYGVFQVDSGERIAGNTERSVYEALELPWITPELRENRGELERAEAKRLPQLIEREDLRGDLHMHTTASDGRNTLEEMIEAAVEFGHSYIAITDHSKALAMTGGLDEDRVLEQIEEIRAKQEENPSIQIFTGIEVDILTDGRLDLEDRVLAELDVVIASIHSQFHLDREEMTNRICRAIQNPHVNILAHPTGRLLLKRDPYALDLDRVIRCAVDHRVCLEINAYPARLDLNDITARQAREMGALLTINSDSHDTKMFRFIDYGVGSARRAWLEAGDVLNTYPVERLRKVLSKEEYR